VPAKDNQEAPDSQYVDVCLIHTVYIYTFICTHPLSLSLTHTHTYTHTHTHTHTHLQRERVGLSFFFVSAVSRAYVE